MRSTLRQTPHEIIFVDDSSPDGTYELASQSGDIAISTRKHCQTKALLRGIESATFPVVITIDSDLENPPELIPHLLRNAGGYDVFVACRSSLPRFSEVLASRMLGRVLGTTDVFSNFRVYRRDFFLDAQIALGETFGAELLFIAKRRACRIRGYTYDPPGEKGEPADRWKI